MGCQFVRCRCFTAKGGLDTLSTPGKYQASQGQANRPGLHRLEIQKPLGTFSHREVTMTRKLTLALLMSTCLVASASAQNQPNPNQVAGKALLQAADAAIGAGKVKSFTITATGWMGYPGQQFATGDLPRSDLKSFTSTVDLASKSAKTEYVRVQGNNVARGGGAGFPVQGEVRFEEGVNGDIAWNTNAQGQATRTAADVAGDRQLMIWANPAGFIQAGLAANNAAATDR